jgi:hypothetical protein
MTAFPSRFAIGLAVAAVLIPLVSLPAAAAPPPNDDFADATVIPSLPFTAPADTREASLEPAPGCPDETTDPSPPSDGRADVWYQYTPTAPGFLEATLSAEYGGFTISVWTGLCGSMTLLASEETSMVRRTGVIAATETGTTYYIGIYSVAPDATTLVVRHHTRPYPAVVRQGLFLARDSFTTGEATQEFRYGRSTDYPIFGDWDGDGRSSVGVVRGNQWFLRNENGTGTHDVTFRYGSAGDTPIVGDWNHDGTDTPAVVRGNTWYRRNSNTSGIADHAFRFGRATDVPVAGAWDSTGMSHAGVFRDGVWYLNNLDIANPFTIRFGMAGDRPIVGDWDGDGIDTPGVVRNGTWYLRNSITSGAADQSFRYGSACDRALTLTQALARSTACGN